MNNKIGAVLVLILSFSITSHAKESDTIRVCGKVYVDSLGNKGIADASVKISYDLVINEVAKPRKHELSLINYESEVYRSLQAGEEICAIGVVGSTEDTLHPVINLTDWAVISE